MNHNHKLLVCLPRYYNLKPLRQNYFSKRDREVNRHLATKQWLDLLRFLNEKGCQIRRIDPINKLPGMVFSSQMGFVIDNWYISSKPLEDGKEQLILKYLEYFTEEDYKIINLPYFFAGSADAIFSHQKTKLWLGYDKRTSKKAAFYLMNLLADEDLHVTALQLVLDRFYYLELCFFPFGDGYALVYPQAFDKNSYGQILSIFGKDHIIEVNQKEALEFVCNSYYIEDFSYQRKGYLVGNKFSQRLKNIIKGLSYSCVEFPLSEFLVGGGSVKSLLLDI